MKKNNKAYAVGWLVLILAIVGAVLLGQLRKPSNEFVQDEAGVLSAAAEERLRDYNTGWDAQYNSIVAFVSVDRVNGDPEEHAYDLADKMGLGNNSALLLVIKAENDYRFVWGGDFDVLMTASATNRLKAALDSGSWQDCVPRFYGEMDDVYSDYFSGGGDRKSTRLNSSHM